MRVIIFRSSSSVCWALSVFFFVVSQQMMNVIEAVSMCPVNVCACVHFEQRQYDADDNGEPKRPHPKLR